MPAHGVSGVYLYGAPITYKDDPATIRQHPEVFIQIDIGQHLKNHVHALAFGGIHDLLRGIGIVMVDHMMGTLFGDKDLSPIGAGGTQRLRRIATGKGSSHIDPITDLHMMEATSDR